MKAPDQSHNGSSPAGPNRTPSPEVPRPSDSLAAASPIRVALVEDESTSRHLLARLISETPGLAVAGCYANAEEAMAQVPLHPPDVLLMDLGLPGLSGTACVRQLRQKLPDLRIIVLTKFEDADHIFHALEAGADGYLLKRRLMSELFGAIHEAYHGGAPMSAEVAVRVVRFFREKGLRAEGVLCWGG